MFERATRRALEIVTESDVRYIVGLFTNGNPRLTAICEDTPCVDVVECNYGHVPSSDVTFNDCIYSYS